METNPHLDFQNLSEDELILSPELKSQWNSPYDMLFEFNGLRDDTLLKATVESLCSGRLTPLIKEELKCRIQSRRLSEGKDELVLQTHSPPLPPPKVSLSCVLLAIHLLKTILLITWHPQLSFLAFTKQNRHLK